MPQFNNVREHGWALFALTIVLFLFGTTCHATELTDEELVFLCEFVYVGKLIDTDKIGGVVPEKEDGESLFDWVARIEGSFRRQIPEFETEKVRLKKLKNQFKTPYVLEFLDVIIRSLDISKMGMASVVEILAKIDGSTYRMSVYQEELSDALTKLATGMNKLGSELDSLEMSARAQDIAKAYLGLR